MATSAPTPPRARAPTQSVFYVVTDPWLFRLITSYQLGMPVLLYKLYVEHSPEPRRGRFTRKQLAELVSLVVEHGTPFHLSLLQSSHIYEDGKWHSPKLGRVPRWAVEHRRADLLQWLVSTRFQLGDPRLLWQEAVTNWESDADLALLDLLHSRSPLTTVKAQRILKEGLPDTPTVRLLQWLKNKCPDLALPRLLTRIAAEQGDANVLRFVAEHRSRTDCDVEAFREAYERGHFDVLEYLVANFATYMRPDFAKTLAVASEPSVQQIVDRHASVFVSAFREVVIDALRKGDCSKAQELLEALERRAKCTFHGSISIDDAASWKGLDGLKFLHERGLAVATTEAMDLAAEKQRWSIVKFLHMERTEGCTTRTMDAACKSGNLKCVRFFHKHRSEGCSTDAMDFAAETGSMEILRYLHTHSSVGCTTDAMDKAASRGHLQVVQFLHENRSEGCTTEALDGAAIGGFLEITQYLCEHRSEGGTVEGVQDALENHHFEIVQVLYDRFPHLFGRELMFKLLLRGAFTIFMSLRDAFPDEANRVVNRVAFEAVRQLSLALLDGGTGRQSERQSSSSVQATLRRVLRSSVGNAFDQRDRVREACRVGPDSPPRGSLRGSQQVPTLQRVCVRPELVEQPRDTVRERRDVLEQEWVRYDGKRCPRGHADGDAQEIFWESSTGSFYLSHDSNRPSASWIPVSSGVELTRPTLAIDIM